MPSIDTLWNVIAHNPQAIHLWLTNSHIQATICRLFGIGPFGGAC